LSRKPRGSERRYRIGCQHGQLSYRRHRFPPEIIQHAIWLYLRFTLSYRDVEELLAERGLDISYETVRRWVLKFGPAIARRLRQCRPRPSDRWHLDEMVVRIARERMYLWRAVDDEGEVLDMLVQRRVAIPTCHSQSFGPSAIVPGSAYRDCPRHPWYRNAG
jgi:transposase-like protein